MSDRAPPVTAWAVVYPVGMRAYGGGQHALFHTKATADLRASGSYGAEVRTLTEAPEAAIKEAVERERDSLLRKFDAYVPADQASSMRYRIVELEHQLARRGRYRSQFWHGVAAGFLCAAAAVVLAGMTPRIVIDCGTLTGRGSVTVETPGARYRAPFSCPQFGDQPKKDLET